MSTQSIEVDALQAGPRATWTAGDFGRIARFIEPEAERFVARLSIPEGARVLDVACGTGNLAVAAARRKATVYGLDIAPNLIEQARKRARAENLMITFKEGNAERLPYADESFDLVASMYGAMFAPNHERVAAELIRVCRKGGVVAMANWTPAGFIGDMFRVVAAHAPACGEAAPPILWGDARVVRRRLREGLSDLRLNVRINRMKYPFSVSRTVELFRLYYGPVFRAFEKLEADGQAALRLELEELWSKHNRAGRNSTHVDAEYLSVIARRV